MEAVIERKQTAFRLATDLLERLKVLAKKRLLFHQIKNDA